MENIDTPAARITTLTGSGKPAKPNQGADQRRKRHELMDSVGQV